MSHLKGKKVAILATHGFEQSELAEPQKALKDAGAEVHVVSPESGKIKGWNKSDWGDQFTVDRKLSDVKSDDYDALVLPGGVMNPDLLRRDESVLEFVQGFFKSDKPVSAICHGPWTLIDAGVARSRKLTSYHSIKTDLKNAGANWVDEEVVVDGNLITSRKPDDLPKFCEKTIDAIAETVNTR